MTAGALTACFALAVGLSTNPFVRSRTDQNDPTSRCLWWANPSITFVQSDKGYSPTFGSEFAAVTGSFQSWVNVVAECSGLGFAEAPPTAKRAVGYNRSGANENLVLFRTELCRDKVPVSDSCWREKTCGNLYDCWFYEDQTIALTTTTFDANTGQVFDGDIELNAGKFSFTTNDGPECPPGTVSMSCVSTDVANTMTHEIGHLVGLDHTAASGSTMNPNADTGDTDKRAVDLGTRDFACRAYPKGRASRMCDGASDFVPAPCSAYRNQPGVVDCTPDATPSDGDDDGGGCNVGSGLWFGLAGLVAASVLHRRARA